MVLEPLAKWQMLSTGQLQIPRFDLTAASTNSCQLDSLSTVGLTLCYDYERNFPEFGSTF